MTIGEFRAFLEGMDVGDAPTPEQWARIREKLGEITVAPTFAPYPLPRPDDGWPYQWPLIVTCGGQSNTTATDAVLRD